MNGKSYALLGAACLVTLAGCANRLPPPEVRVRRAEYQRLAFVCAPTGTAEAKYTPIILEEIRTTAAEWLSPHLRTADCLPDVAVDTTASPPKVQLGAKAADYDGICCLVYSYDGRSVRLDAYLLNVKSGESVWTYRLETQDTRIGHRLGRHAHYIIGPLRDDFFAFPEDAPRIQPATKAISVEINSEPRGARIYENGRLKGIAPLTLTYQLSDAALETGVLEPPPLVAVADGCLPGKVQLRLDLKKGQGTDFGHLFLLERDPASKPATPATPAKP